MGKKAGRVEGKTGQGLYPSVPRSKPSVASPQPCPCEHVCVHTEVSRDGSLGTDLAAVSSELGA